jgi:hypothetical protein
MLPARPGLQTLSNKNKSTLISCKGRPENSNTQFCPNENNHYKQYKGCQQFVFSLFNLPQNQFQYQASTNQQDARHQKVDVKSILLPS